MLDDGLWTLDELAGRVAAALAVDYAGPASGRVREVPDRRAIRWYTTIGLVDRPVAMRGRTALYGPRHLLQLVAIKRRQADGLALADIQAELAGATDDMLESIASLPDGVPPVSGVKPSHADGARPRFWAERPAPSQVPLPEVYAVKLAANVTLLIDTPPDARFDPEALRRAAQPLLDLLAEGTTS